jgi:hypothetical protein
LIASAVSPLVIGFDPAWTGGDRHAVALRRGRKLIRVESKTGLDAAAGWCKQVIDAHKQRRMFIDVGGVGAGVYDRLKEMGYGEIVRAVNFGSAPFEPQPLDDTAGRKAARRTENRVTPEMLRVLVSAFAGASAPG